MAKASIELIGGGKVVVEGTPEEIQKVLALYGEPLEPVRKGNATSRTKPLDNSKTPRAPSVQPDLAKIIARIKDSPSADQIADRILDRSSAVDRILLPLYIIHEHFGNSFGLTSGEIGGITRDLGTPISTANVAHALSGSASRYVIGDKVRKRGVPVRYKLSRKGLLYIKTIITSDANDRKK